MQRATIVATALAACLTLAGCAEGDGGEGRPATTEEPRSQGFDDYDFGDPVTNERGELVKQVGQWGGFGAPDGSVVGVVRVTDIEPGFVCPQDPALEPENGQFVALTFEVETSADLGPNLAGSDTIDITPELLVARGDDGLEEDVTGAGPGCVGEDERLPTGIGPDEKAEGIVVIDTSAGAGTVVLDGAPMGVQGAWAWGLSPTP